MTTAAHARHGTFYTSESYDNHRADVGRTAAAVRLTNYSVYVPSGSPLTLTSTSLQSQPKDLAVIDQDARAGHEGAAVASKQQQRAVQVARRSDAATWQPLDELLAEVRVEEGGLRVTRGSGGCSET